MTLPTSTQFQTAKAHISRAAEFALLVHYFEEIGGGEIFKTHCVDELKKAIAALGFQIVQPTAPKHVGIFPVSEPEWENSTSGRLG